MKSNGAQTCVTRKRTTRGVEPRGDHLAKSAAMNLEQALNGLRVALIGLAEQELVVGFGSEERMASKGLTNGTGTSQQPAKQTAR